MLTCPDGEPSLHFIRPRDPVLVANIIVLNDALYHVHETEGIALIDANVLEVLARRKDIGALALLKDVEIVNAISFYENALVFGDYVSFEERADPG